MAKNKTAGTDDSVDAFLNGVEDEKRRLDSFELARLLKEQTGFEPRMWGASIIGFGTYHYKYESGHEGDAPLVGFSPRKNAIVLYLASEFRDKDSLLQKFGKYKAGKGCIYINKLADVDKTVLNKMIANSVAHLQKLYR